MKLTDANETPAVQFVNTRKVYQVKGAPEIVALTELNLTIGRGEFFGLLGHNGAGKSTAINIMSGIARPTQGDVLVHGYSITKQPNEAKRILGVVCQELIADSFFTLKTMLRLQSKLSGVVPDNAWIDYLLETLALSKHTKKTTRELSGGMKRRMMIARALVHKPKVIVLDEPTAGVDVELRHSMWEFIGELHKTGCTIILTTHYLEEAEEFCERLAILKNGSLVTLKTQKELLSLGGKPVMAANFLFALAPADLTRLRSCFPNIVIKAHESKTSLGFQFEANDCVSLANAHSQLSEVLNSLPTKPDSLGIEKASLENVFLQLSQ